MAMKVTCTVIDGEIMSECRNGVERGYMPDIQGNTIALLDNTQTITDTFEYWPYGEVRTRTGTTATRFQFVGTRGYYTDANGRAYVRARYLRTTLTRWLTEDPIGFKAGMNKYGYCGQRTSTFSDASGLAAIPVYGNYCGPGWPLEGDRPIPIEQLDTCCQKHDDCYDKCGGTGKSNLACQILRRIGKYPPCCACVNNCDLGLCICSTKANCRWNFDCNVWKGLIGNYFCTGLLF